MSEVVGSLAVELRLERDKFDRDLQALQNLKNSTIGFAASLDTRAFRQQVNSLGQLKPTIDASVRLTNINAVEQQLRVLGRDRFVKIGVSIDESKLTSLDQRLKGYSDKSFKVTAQVDDRQLTALNKHLDLKQKHFGQVDNYFKSSPLTPRVDFSNLNALDRRLGSLQSKTITVNAAIKYSSTQPPNIAQAVTQKLQLDTGDFEKSISNSIERAFSQVKGGGLLSGLGSLVSAPLKLATSAIFGVGGTIASSLILSITQPLGSGLGAGLSTALEKSLSNSVGSSSLLGEKVGGAIGASISSGVSSKLQGLGDLLEKQIAKIDDKKTRTELQEKLAQVRELPQKTRAAVTETIGTEAIQRESLLRRGQRQQQRDAETPIVREQSVIEFRGAVGKLDETRASAVKRLTFIEGQIAAKQRELAGAEQRVRSNQALLNRAQASGADDATLQGISEELNASARELSGLATSIQALEKGKALIQGAVKQAEQDAIKASETSKQVAPKSQPKEFVELAKIALGDRFDADKLPELAIADESLKKANAVSQYDPLRNRIEVTAEFFQQLQESVLLSERQANILAEELQHAIDLDFGSARGIQASREGRVVGRPLIPTPDEFSQLAPNLGLYDPKRREIELSGKTGAIRSTEAYLSQRGTIAQQTNASAFAATKDIADSRSQGIGSKLSEFVSFAQSRGDDLSKVAAAYTSAIEKIQSGFGALAQEALQASSAASLDEAKIEQFTQRQQSLFNQLLAVEDKLSDRIANYKPPSIEDKTAANQPLALPLKPLALPELVSVEVAQQQQPRRLALASPITPESNSLALREPVKLNRTEQAKNIALKAGQAARSVVDAGQNVQEIVSGAIAQAKDLDARFSTAYKAFQSALKNGDARLVEAYKKTMVDLTRRSKGDIDALIGELKNSGDKSGAIGQLGGVKGRLTQKENLVTRSAAKFEQSQAARGEDLKAASLGGAKYGALDAALDEFKRTAARAIAGINATTAKFAEVEKQPTLRGTLGAAAKSPKVQAIAKDLVVNTGGFVASQVAGQSGQVAGLGGDLIGALAARQSLNAGISGVQAYRSLNQKPEFQKAPLRQKAGMVLREGSQRFQGMGAIQNDELFGDLTGFAIGNAAAQLPVPLPLKGAAVAMAAVPQLAKLREKITGRLSEDTSARASGEDLTAQSLAPGAKQAIRTLDSKRRKILEQLEQSIGNAIDSISLLLKQQPDLINNAKVTRTLARLNQTAQRVLEGQTDVVNDVFEAETAKFSQQLNALNARVQARLKAQPDFGLVADRGISNSAQEEGSRVIDANRSQIRSNERLINRNERKGLAENTGLIRIEDPAPNDFGKGAIGAAKRFLSGLNDDLTNGVLKRTSLLLIESKTLVNDLRTSEAVAKGAGDTTQANRLGGVAQKAERAIGQTEKILSKPRVEVNQGDISKLKQLEKELRAVYKVVDRPPPGGGGGGGFGGFLEKIKEQAGGLPGVLKQAVIGFIGFQVLQNIIPQLQQFVSASVQAAIKLDNLKTALSFGSGSAINAGKDLAFIRKEADRLGVPLGAVQEGFVKLAASTKGTSSSGQVTKDLVTGVSQAATTLGLSSENVEGIFNALGQSFSKGKIQAEELRSQIGDRLPGAFSTAARAMGVTEAQLNKLLEAGAVTSDEFGKKFGKQLQIEYAGSAESASKNVQSSLFRLSNAFQVLQENTGQLFTPAVKSGADALTVAIGLLGQNIDKVILLAGVLAVRFSGLDKVKLPNLAASIGDAVSSLQNFNIGEAIGKGKDSFKEGGTFGKGGAARGIAKEGAGLLGTGLALYAGFEATRTISQAFTLDEKGKEFKEFADQGEQGLKRIEAAAKKARGEVNTIPENVGRKTESTGIVDDVLNYVNNSNQDYIESLRTKDPEEYKRLNGEAPETRTYADVNRENRAMQIDRFQTGTRELLGQQFRSGQITNGLGEFRQQLGAAQGLDNQIIDKQNERNRLASLPRTDKTEIGKLDEEIKGLSQKRSETVAPLAEYQANLESRIKGTKSLIEGGGISDGLKSNLEASLKELQDAQTRITKLQNSFGTAADKVLDFKNALDEMSIALEQVKRDAEIKFTIDSTQDINSQIANFGADRNASINAPVTAAKRKSTQTQSELEGKRQELDGISQKLNQREVSDVLGSVTVGSTGKSLSKDSSIKEIELAKSGLSDSDPKKKILEQLILFKKTQDEQTKLQLQGAQDRQAIQKAEEAATLALLDKSSAQRESLSKQRLAKSQVGLIKQQISGKIYESDASVKGAKIQQSQTGGQLDSTQRELSDLQAAFQAKLVSAEEYEKRKQDIENRLSDLTVQNAQAELAVVKAVEAAKLEAIERSAVQRESLIKRAESSATVGLIRKKIGKNVDESDLEIEEAEISQNTANAQLGNTQKQAAELADAYSKGIVKSEEFEKRNRDLQNSIGDLTVRQAQAELAVVEAKNRKILEGYEQISKRANAAINVQVGDRSNTIRAKQLEGGIVGEGGQAEILKVELSANQQRLDLKRKEFAQVQELRNRGVISEKEAEDRRIQITADTQQLESQVIEQITQQRLKAIQNQVDAEKRSTDEKVSLLDREKAAQDKSIAQLERRKSLLDAELGVSKAISDSRQSALKIGVDRASESADLFKQLGGLDSEKGGQTFQRKAVLRDQLSQFGANPDDKKGIVEAIQNKQALEAEADAEKTAALLKQQELERESVRLGLLKEQSSARIAVIEAKRAELLAKQNLNAAKGELNKALKTGDANEIANAQSNLKDAQEGLNLASQGRGLAESGVGVIDKQVQKELEANDIRAAQTRSELDAENQAKKRSRDRELAGAADEVKYRGSLSFSGMPPSAAAQAGLQSLGPNGRSELGGTSVSVDQSDGSEDGTGTSVTINGEDPNKKAEEKQPKTLLGLLGSIEKSCGFLPAIQALALDLANDAKSIAANTFESAASGIRSGFLAEESTKLKTPGAANLPEMKSPSLGGNPRPLDVLGGAPPIVPTQANFNPIETAAIQPQTSSVDQAVSRASNNQDVVAKLEQLYAGIVQLANTPRSLTISTPTPVEDYAKFQNQQAGSTLRGI
jgi:tape measure domain-containing protein